VPWPVQSVSQVNTRYGTMPTAIYSWKIDPTVGVLPWMEQHVGKRGIDWDWMLLDSFQGMVLPIDMCKVVLKFRRGKGKHASMAALKFG
jgi:hypothetical protein